MRRLTPLWSCTWLAISCSQLQAMTLTDAIQSTVETHPQIQASQNARLSADEEVKVAKGGYLPSVDVLAGYGRKNIDSPATRGLTGHNTETGTYGTSELRLRQMLFDGFNTPNEVARTEAVVNSRAYYTQGTAEALALRTVEVYLDVLKRREMVTLATNNLQAHLRMNDQIALRSETGVGRTADSDQAEARLALAQNNLYTEQVNLADAETNFLSVTGRKADELVSPASAKSSMPADIAGARQTVASNNPLLKSAQADIQAAEKQYESAKSPFYPRFDAELATSADNDVELNNANQLNGHVNGWRAGVSMNYNLFNGMRDKARLQSSAYKVNEAMDIRNNALRELNENLALAWNAMENARLQTPKARDYADYSARVREAYQQQFTLGQRTLLDLLDSENELFTANRRYTEVRYTEEFSMYRVIAATGELLRQQNIALPAEAVAASDVSNQASLPEMK
ncbi:MAG: TolC family outer membrane protein [Pseudomonadaceae bacterium]|nr:TolC family outer membrane protein [Pseudomonadaceae bacterium]